jgi:putative SOS response-associated peptidase YedK
VSGYYEWVSNPGGKTKQPVFISMRSGIPFALAGLWEVWHAPEGDEVHTCTILTTDANAYVKPFHHRMPVILGSESYAEWLDPGEKRAGEIDHLLKPWETDSLAVFPVSTLVNSPAYDLPACIDPLEEN